jgi:hypothetical protein
VILGEDVHGLRANLFVRFGESRPRHPSARAFVVPL